jgi:hypothetical protein
LEIPRKGKGSLAKSSALNFCQVLPKVLGDIKTRIKVPSLLGDDCLFCYREIGTVDKIHFLGYRTGQHL